MSIMQIFLASINNPKKIAAFRVLPIGKVLRYVFIYVAVLTILSIIHFSTGFKQDSSNMAGLLEYVEDMQWILYPFAFLIQFIMSTLLIFIRISIVALIGMIILKLTKRRGEYRHVWRTTAFAYTVPTILSILFLYAGFADSVITLVSTFICLVYLTIALRYYPKK